MLQDGQVVLLAQGPWFKVTFAETSILQCMAQFMTERMVEAGDQDGVGWCRHALMTFAVSAHCVQEEVEPLAHCTLLELPALLVVPPFAPSPMCSSSHSPLFGSRRASAL